MAGGAPPHLVLPRPILLGIAAVAERIAPRGSLTRSFVVSGSLRNVCSSAKARVELGYAPVQGSRGRRRNVEASRAS